MSERDFDPVTSITKHEDQLDDRCPLRPVFVLTASFDSGLIIDEYLWDLESLARRLDEVAVWCPDAELSCAQLADESVTEATGDETGEASPDYLAASLRLEALEAGLVDDEPVVDLDFWNHAEVAAL